VLIALVTSVIVFFMPSREREGLRVWTPYLRHYEAYAPKVDEWNANHPDRPVDLQILNLNALEQRMLSGFLSDTPIADLMEVSSDIAAKAFLGPLDQVGFYDMTDRLHAEGVYQQFVEAAFAPYISRGRIFGLPFAAHPVLLSYRADIVEAAGIDVSEIETWDDYFRVMRSLMCDLDGDGRPDRFLLSLSEVNTGELVMLLLQNGGELFDENEAPNFASEPNAHALATITTWLTGPNRVCIDIPLNVSGHRLRQEGFTIGAITPGWLIGRWKEEIPGLSGKIKLMPLPAWERGGRRTSVAQSAMLGINKTSGQLDLAWEIALHLYTSAEIAEQLFRTNAIILPVKALWNESFYDEPSDFVSGQTIGRMYIEQAPHIPRRPSSPYTPAAEEAIRSVAMELRNYAEKNEVYGIEALKVEALRLLNIQQAVLKKLISKNVFIN